MARNKKNIFETVPTLTLICAVTRDIIILDVFYNTFVNIKIQKV